MIITIEEEIPFGVYFNNNQRILFSRDLVVLDILDNEDLYNNLITYYGENSLNRSVNFLDKIKAEFRNMINLAFFIEYRRWNVRLNNNILLKLPEFNINKAFNNYMKIYENSSEDELKNIDYIDLRLDDKAVIKYK